jgi:hypothetical protein
MLAFHHYDKITESINLKRRNICFGSWFQRLQFKTDLSCLFGPVARLYLMVRAHGGTCACFMEARKQREKKKGRGRVPISPARAQPSMTVPPPPHGLGTSLSTCGLWRTFEL